MAGRPNKYITNVKPYLDKIPILMCNMTQEQIAEELGITYQSLCRYKKQYPELNNAMKRGKRDLVVELKGCLLKKAKGYTITETKTVTNSKGGWEEIVTEKHYPPDIGAINLLLKNLDKDNWANDPQNLAIRKEELDLKREIAGKEQTVLPVQIINDIPRPEVIEDDECDTDSIN